MWRRVDELPMTYVYEEREEDEAAAAKPGGADKSNEPAKDGGAK